MKNFKFFIIFYNKGPLLRSHKWLPSYCFGFTNSRLLIFCLGISHAIESLSLYVRDVAVNSSIEIFINFKIYKQIIYITYNFNIKVLKFNSIYISKFVFYNYIYIYIYKYVFTYLNNIKLIIFQISLKWIKLKSNLS